MILKIVLPVLLGVGVVVWLFGREFSVEQFRQIPLSWHTWGAVALSLIFVAGRELGMMWRWRVLTDKRLSWGKCFRVTMMCEFTSAITPTSAGGSALSMIFLSREGINAGRSTTISITTLMLDQLFVVVACPIILLLMPPGSIFGFGGGFSIGVRLSFWIVYGGVVLIAVALFMGAFVIPHKLAGWLNSLFSLKPLRRWQNKVRNIGENMVDAGRDLKRRHLKWWSTAFAATCLTWLSRYLVVNMLFWGFAPEAPQAVVFGRQFVVWTLLTVSPTPGGAGVSEWLFTNYYGDLISDISMALVIAVVWRILTYYLYLLTGIFTIPSWLRKKGSAQA